MTWKGTKILVIGLSFFCFYLSIDCTTEIPRGVLLNSLTTTSSQKGSPRPTFNFKYNQFVNVSSVVAMINPPNLYRRLKTPFKWYQKDYDRELINYGNLQHLDTPIFAGFPDHNAPKKQKQWQKYGWGSHEKK